MTGTATPPTTEVAAISSGGSELKAPRNADAEERCVVRDGKRLFLKGDQVIGVLPLPAPKGLAAVAHRLEPHELAAAERFQGEWWGKERRG